MWNGYLGEMATGGWWECLWDVICVGVKRVESA
jgi:hypothetical protein